MKHIRRLLMAALLLMTSSAWAYDFEVDGIYYRIINNTEPYEVSVDRDSNNPSYSGDVVIPASVIYEGVEYSVTSIGFSAFRGCTDLTSVIIGNSVTSIGNSAFYECTGLTSIEIPNSVTRIGESAFYGCTGLTSIDIPDSVTSIGSGAFYGCTGLNSIIVADDNPVYDSRNTCNAIIETESNKMILGCKTTIIPNSVTHIGENAFDGCTGLTSIDIPDSVTSIGSGAFCGCTGLTSIVIPNSVTRIGESAFYGCTGLTSIEIPNSVTSIGSHAFDGCTGLTSIEIPNSVTFIAVYAFRGCTGLTSIVIPNSVTRIESGAFNGCTGLNSIIVADDNPVYDSRNNCNAIIHTGTNRLLSGCMNTIVPNSVSSIGAIAFHGHKGLKSIEIPNSVTSIGIYAFQESGLESIEIPNSVTSIAEGTFDRCTGLTSIEIPNSVTSIGRFSFYGCTALTSIAIPNSVTSIGEWAFRGTGMTSVTVLADTPPSLDNLAFPSYNNTTLYVPCGRKTAYSNSDWNRYFTNIIDTELIHDFMVRADDESHGSVLVTDCANQTVTVLAEPNEGYLFLNWTVNGQVVSRTNPYTFVVNEDIELVVNFTGTGVEEETAQAVSVSPNPAQDRVNVSCEEMQNISLFSTDGRRVKTINAMGANEMEIDLSGMAKGLYMIRIETQSGTTVNRKIVVK